MHYCHSENVSNTTRFEIFSLVLQKQSLNVYRYIILYNLAYHFILAKLQNVVQLHS